MHWSSFLIFLLVLLQLADAGPTNRTIDDTLGDSVTGTTPIYKPGRWQGPECTGCAIQPPLDNVFERTYSALTYRNEDPYYASGMSIEFSFKGTAVYVFFILANFVADHITTETLCDFTLDGTSPVRFHHVPSTSKEYQFHSLVYKKENLPNIDHTLLISTSGVDRHVFTSFDYAQYTFDDTPIPVPPPPPVTTTPSITSITSTTSRSDISSSTSSTSITLESQTPNPTSSSNTTTDIPTSGPNPSHGPQTGDQSGSQTGDQTGSQTGDQTGSQSGDQTDPHPGSQTGAIVGGIAGVLFVLFALLLLLYCRRRNKLARSSRARTSTSNRANVPFTIDGLPLSTLNLPQDSRRPQPPNRPASNSPPPYDHSTSSGGDSSEALIRHRQAEIDAQIQGLRQEIYALERTNSTHKPNRRRAALHSSLGRRRSERHEMAQLRAQISAMGAEIGHLQQQLNSDWARGLSDDPPPGYSTVGAPSLRGRDSFV
ncbi:hypothetical protein D9615_001536 [Tricholomella constricta]|uniref:Uncharacterized protein n=1 Tax=Tricholomella constricta TaxID=117010 RepID=A0A8H5HNJ8_9AGAR|nr:hypothetical protein D9615_001536 [Tricholomella constricta]